ncbi:hypothetical protein G6321_00031500 [Bradyrhizobium barranii subsp. barranii]|uniref:Porin family protein n=1 Tax=Bradyrhizobium barranii subsp. barranii TaxID=2823807 RepID=A0A7Z0TU13_9BRAD|nr:porin family protein [Bradyrhizobium barranii]UGX90359.1 hypothetical protein G6321_00031500 [Bradyrhizobium barranii subsp. barranii]
MGALTAMSPAFGADLPIYGKAPPVAAPAYDWSGFYVGVFGGWGLGNHNVNNATGPVGFANFTANYESTGGFGGGEIGANWQSGNIVVGIEADGFGADIKGNDNFALGWNDATKLGWGATLRGRGGIAVDRLLLFFTGGWAYGELTHTNTNPGVGVDTFKATRSGLTAGGGIAYAFKQPDRKVRVSLFRLRHVPSRCADQRCAAVHRGEHLFDRDGRARLQVRRQRGGREVLTPGGRGTA